MSYALGQAIATEKRKEERIKLRDEFAKSALQGLLSRADVFNFDMYTKDPWRAATWAYEVADAMLKERDVETSDG